MYELQSKHIHLAFCQLQNQLCRIQQFQLSSNSSLAKPHEVLGTVKTTEIFKNICTIKGHWNHLNVSDIPATHMLPGNRKQQQVFFHPHPLQAFHQQVLSEKNFHDQSSSSAFFSPRFSWFIGRSSALQWGSREVRLVKLFNLLLILM